jgi:hypothetical protein
LILRILRVATSERFFEVMLFRCQGPVFMPQK